MVLWRPTRPSRTNTQKGCPFHYRGLECKSRKSRATWSNRQIWPWSTKWSRGKANRVLPRERTGHSKHPLPTTQEKTLHIDITRWSTLKSGWLYFLQSKMKFYTVSKNKTWSSSFSVLSFCFFIPFMGFSRQEYWSGLPFPCPVDCILSELFTITCPLWALHSMAHSFIELDKAVVLVIRLVSFLRLWFSVCLPSDGEG